MRRILYALTFLPLGCVACSLATAAPGRTAVAGGPTSKVEKMIDVGGRRLHACFYGQGAPAVVLLSGANAPQAYWDPIVAQVAEKTTVVTYDRAGLWDPRLPVPPQKGGGRAAQPPSSWPVVQTEPECNDLTWRQVETITSYPRVPLTVITAGILQSPPGLDAAALQQAKERRKFDQEALTRIIPGGKHVLLPDVGHDVIHQAPAAVMGEILEMVGRIASLPGKPTQEPPQGQAPKLSENLSALEPFIGPTWIGSVPNDPRLGEIVLKCADALNASLPDSRRDIIRHSAHLPLLEQPEAFNKAGADSLMGAIE
jgi:pimeloyl-ACP methyl ester carboxylesterase